VCLIAECKQEKYVVQEQYAREVKPARVGAGPFPSLGSGSPHRVSFLLPGWTLLGERSVSACLRAIFLPLSRIQSRFRFCQSDARPEDLPHSSVLVEPRTRMREEKRIPLSSEAVSALGWLVILFWLGSEPLLAYFHGSIKNQEEP
jgi:hypothetical protein